MSSTSVRSGWRVARFVAALALLPIAAPARCAEPGPGPSGASNAGAGAPASARRAPDAPDEAVLRRLVATLASPEYGGRSGEGGRKASALLVDTLRGLGLEPAFDGRYEQPIPGSDPEREQGRNVGAQLLGADPALRDEWIIVAAHYDHLGVRDGVLYPGADDNASGVAMMLEVARGLVRAPAHERPRRSLMFIGFDLEELGLFGSRHFVEHPPVPLERVKLFITADMIGRSLGGVCTSSVFVMGTEHAPGLRPWINASARGEPLKVGLLGSDLLVLNRSDYGPFRARRVPYLFFSTGENPCYHSPRDVPETLDYPKLAAICRLILGVVRHASRSDVLPGWSPLPDNPLDEALAVRDVLRTLLENRQALPIAPLQMRLMTNTLQSLEAIAARGVITPAERTAMVNIARIILVSLF